MPSSKPRCLIVDNGRDAGQFLFMMVDAVMYRVSCSVVFYDSMIKTGDKF